MPCDGFISYQTVGTTKWYFDQADSDQLTVEEFYEM
jgi:hypothetical protein